MRTLAIYNLKGGVGKSTSAVNLAYCAAQAGLSTALWDLDDQGAASYVLEPDNDHALRTKRLIRGKTDLSEALVPTAYPRLSLLPAASGLRHMDVLLDREKNSSKVLRSLIGDLARDCDLLILDCPPSFSMLSENIFTAADAVIMPLIPAQLSLRAYERLDAYFRKQKLKRRRLFAFFSLVDRRRKLHREWLAAPPAELVNRLNAFIPYAAVVERMTLQRAPLGHVAPRSEIAAAYRALWAEIDSRAPEAG